MKQYIDLLRKVRTEGVYRMDRTGVGTYSIFGHQMRFDLNEGFPLVTTKRIYTKAVIHELLWFLSGSSNIKYLTDNNVNIWNEWADENGELGPVYPVMWRNYPIAGSSETVDQVTNLIEEIKTNPSSRRLIISAWNPGLLPDSRKTHNENIKNGKQVLPPCHTLVQFYVLNNKLSCQLYARSQDIFLGTPFNIATYALLTMMIAQVCDLELGEYVHSSGDTHLYANHLEQADLQLQRATHPLPKIILNKNIKNILDFKYEDITLVDYQYHPSIKAEVAI